MSIVNQGTVGAIYSTKMKQYEQFDWKIENFSSLSKQVDHYYRSPTFNYSGYAWHLRLYTNGESRSKSEGWISVYLSVENLTVQRAIYFVLGNKTKKGNIEEFFHTVYTFDKDYTGWGPPRALNQSELLRRKDELTPSDCLTVIICISNKVSRLIKDTLDASVQTEAEDKKAEAANGEVQSEKKRGEKALEDIGKLLDSGENSDVTVQVGDVHFKAHKIILSARTPVLSAMFQHETAEKASNKICISDCDPGVFKEFLHYIYTGNAQELTAQNCFALYRVADKYLADDLKLQCLLYIQDTLCVETFCDAVELALSYGETDLLQLAIDFASKNIRLIIRSVAWQKFSKEHSTEANEILIKSLGPP